MAKKKLKTWPKILLTLIITIVAGYFIFTFAQYLIIKSIPRSAVETHEDAYYLNRDFGFIPYISVSDYNRNGIDDQTDILNGEKKYAELNPEYVSKYYEDGYPPEDEGVDTDLTWFALKEAGYLLKDMISQDIKERNQIAYHIDIIDDNIDFRRVSNQEIFFKEYFQVLDPELETTNLINYQPGDIIIFDDSDHVAMISDKRNVNAVPYIIQNRGENQMQKEEDFLETTDYQATGHYRLVYNDKLKELLAKIK